MARALVKNEAHPSAAHHVGEADHDNLRRKTRLARPQASVGAGHVSSETTEHTYANRNRRLIEIKVGCVVKISQV